MIDISWISSSPIWSLIGWTILHSLWQFSLIAIILSILLWVLPSRKANFRYAILLFSLIGTIVISGFTITKFISDKSITNDLSIGNTDGLEIELLPSPEATPYSGLLSSSWSEIIPQLESLTPYLSIGWIIGVLFSLLYMLFGMLRLRVLSKKGTSTISEEWAKRFQILQTKMGVNRKVQLLLSDLVQGPITFKCFKPVILLPASLMSGLTVPQIEALILHELAHIRRYDFIVNIFQEFVETLFFYHPAVWWISKKIREEREHCCDDLVLGTQNDPFVYADALTQVQLNHFFIKKNLAMSANNNKGIFSKRIFRMFGKYDQKPSVIKSFLVLILLVFVFSSFSLLSSTASPTDEGLVIQNKEAVVIQDTIPNEEVISKTKFDIHAKDDHIEIKNTDQKNPPLLIVDGVKRGRYNNNIESTLHPNEIDHINVLKGDAATKTYGKDGSFGVVEIYTKGKKAAEPTEIIIEEIHEANPPLLIIDGENKGRYKEELVEPISPSEIQHIEVTKGPKAIEKFGEEGTFGAVEIVTKNKEKPVEGVLKEKVSPTSDEKIKLCCPPQDTTKNPLFVIDGEIISNSSPKALKELDPNNIQKINVLKGEKAIQKYGHDGQNGVVEIWTKKMKKLLALQKQMQEKVKKLQQEYLEIQEKIGNKELSQLQMEEQAKKLEEQIKAIAEMEQVMTKEDLEKKVEQLEYIHEEQIEKLKKQEKLLKEMKELKVKTGSEKLSPFNFQAFPNPASSQVTIQFFLQENSKVKLEVFTLDGKLIKTIADASLDKGQQTFTWEPAAKNKGIFLIQLTSQEANLTKQIVVE